VKRRADKINVDGVPAMRAGCGSWTDQLLVATPPSAPPALRRTAWTVNLINRGPEGGLLARTSPTRIMTSAERPVS
jgi:hypothetical protein